MTAKRIGLWVGCLLLAVGGCAATSSAPRFSPETFRSHIEVLAADELEGRGLETQGIDLAAGYIAGQFAAAGVEPGGANGTYFQPFPATVGANLVERDTRLAFGGAEVSPVLREDYVPFAFSSNDAFEGPVVFAGYGIVNAEKKHDDYANLDVKGKVVLVLRREPNAWSDDGGQPSPQRASFQAKAYEAKNRGAAALLVVNAADGDDRLMRFGRRGSEAYGIPAMHITRETAEKLLSAGGLASLNDLEERIEKEGSVVSAALNGVTASGKAGIATKQVTARNVIGVVRGNGLLADEYIVIGAHFDHLGIARERPGFGRQRSDVRGQRSEGGDQTAEQDSPELQIHNGADDNASGTSGVIELAKAFAKRADLKRSYLFIAFTGEESGLYGSKHFVEQPTVPLENIVAMLNMDMIGRLPAESRELQVFGTKAAEEFEAILAKYANHSAFKLRGDASALGPSDHDSFYRKKIPAVHFFTGLHEDYHRPGDDTEKVNAAGGADVVGYVYAVADEIGSNPKRPTYHEVKERAQIPGRPGRVSMGVMPSYTEDSSAEGMRVDGVISEGPAAKAGMKDGDHIVSIDGKPVKNVYDYMGALQNAKPGDVCAVVVRRGQERVPLSVTLAGRQGGGMETEFRIQN